MWQLLVLAVAVVAIALTSKPKTQKPKPQALDEESLPKTDEGTPQCVVFGDCWTADFQALSYGNLRTRPIKTKSGK
jgi:hypothetical protein